MRIRTQCCRGLVACLVCVLAWDVRSAPIVRAAEALPRIAVIPVRDTVSDVATAQLATALHDALAQHTGLQLIPSDKLGAIAEYHAATELLPTAVVTPEVESWRQALQAAKRHFLAFANASALRQTRQVVDGFRAQPALRAVHGEVLAEALLTEALIHHSNRRPEATTEALRALAALAPHYNIAGHDFPPSLVTQWERARAAAATRSGVGSVTLRTTPPAAEVRLNGVPAGVTPLTIRDLPVGSYDIALTAPRYGTITKHVAVLAGREARLDAALRWQRPAGARERRMPNTDVAPASAPAQVVAAVRMGALARAERVVIVDVDETDGRRGLVRAQVVDTELRVGLKPLTIPFDRNRQALHARLATMAEQVAKQAATDLRSHPGQAVDPVEWSDPRFLAQRGERRRIAPALWIAIGAAALGGIAAGVLLSRGGGEPPTTGGLVIRFE
ncbi:MAG: PEGA domain-containing protein [Deltaproteobacteria bacterium]|nr:PEGA domain-containing protein [Deltaproteobacteria bacterium]